MGIVIEDVHDLIHLLAANPALREELRPLILDDGYWKIPGALDRLAERIAGLEARFEDLDKRLEAFRHETYEFRDEMYLFREASLKFQAEMLAFRDATNTRFDAVDVRFDAVDARFEAVDARFDGIDDQLHSMKTDIGHLRGDVLEGRYIDHVRPWFGKWLRPVELTFVDDLVLVEDALEAGRISQAEVDDLRHADLLVKGRSRAKSGLPEGEVVLAVEVSTVIDTKDVKRAVRRAEILARAGYAVVPFCGGYTVIPTAEEEATAHSVVLDFRRMR